MSISRRGFVIVLATMLAVTVTVSGCNNDRLAAEGDTVLVHYTLTLADGTEYESSQGGDPMEFTLGAGVMLPAFENAA